MDEYEAIIGVEVHAELETQSKMFCTCRVVDPTQAEPNTAVCQVCAGMPGVLPVVNQRAVEYALRVALALECEIAPISIFARKNYFYPDLPKGYQISQYESPLARHGRLSILTSEGEHIVGIRRVHLEEDTGKLTHVNQDGKRYSLVDLNRAGIPLLEIVSEPEMHTAEQVRAYATSLHSILRYLGVNSGDMQKGILRVEPNISVRKRGKREFGTRVEIKNLNSFRALERSVDFEIQRQSAALREGKLILQETLGWDDVHEKTFTQRVKEAEDDYRYFPEPDLPPLQINRDWVKRIRADLPELPIARLKRFMSQYQMNAYDAEVLTADKAVADYYERLVEISPEVSTKTSANWVTGELFGLLNQAGLAITATPVTPQSLAELILMVVKGEINQNTGKLVLEEMFRSGKSATAIVSERSLAQISDAEHISVIVQRVLEENPEQLKAYQSGKYAIERWFFGQVMRTAGGRANPQVVREELERQLVNLRKE